MVVTFGNYTPPTRDDGIPWTQVLIEQSAAATGPWTGIETIPLSPVDSDPRYPLARSFTTELATVEDGWYRLTFVDGTGDASVPTPPVQDIADAASSIRPTVAQISSLMRARLKTFGSRVDSFTANDLSYNDMTTPTAEQVDDLIDIAVDVVLTKLGLTFPSKYYRLASQAVKFKTACLVEITYYPEEANDDNSAYSLYQAQYDELMATMILAIRDAAPGESGRNFISVPMIGSRGYPDPFDYDLYDLLI